MPASAATAKRLHAAAPIFAALGDERRLRIVARLCATGPLSIVRLAEGAHVSRQAITKHLDSLERAGLLTSRWAGRERVCELRTQRLAEVRKYLDRISDQWDEALLRLATLVEKPG